MSCRTTRLGSSCSILRIRQHTLEFSFLHHVTFAYATFQFLAIQHADVTPLILNQSLRLKFSGSFGHALAADTQIVGDPLLRYHQIIIWQTIKTQQEPAA